MTHVLARSRDSRCVLLQERVLGIAGAVAGGTRSIAAMFLDFDLPLRRILSAAGILQEKASSLGVQTYVRKGARLRREAQSNPSQSTSIHVPNVLGVFSHFIDIRC